MHEASYYEKLEDRKVKCFLCPHDCIIGDGKRGICGVRLNVHGTLISEVYGYPIAVHTDPVEKKPLYHFYPGRQILSLGTVGCNMKCFYCQNCDISQATINSYGKIQEVSVSELTRLAEIKQMNIGVAYTYNEPTVYYEYMYDLARDVHHKNLKNVVVTNGFINEKPLENLLPYADAFNVDLKAFDNEFYKVHTKSKLKPVLDTIKTIAESGKHLEITNLVIPNLNEDEDEFRKMTEWIATVAGPDTPLHLSRYFPRYLANEPVTPLFLLKDFRLIAKESLNYVYLGNVQNNHSANTYCKTCHKLVIERMGYFTSTEGLDAGGHCVHCGTEIIKYL